jgi:membrane protease YdiL (CAAX protease family)
MNALPPSLPLPPSPAPPPPVPPPPASEPGAARERPRASWSVVEAIGLYLVGNVGVGQLLVAGIALALLGIRELPAGGATLETLAVSALVALAFVAVVVAWMRRRHPGWEQAVGLRTQRGLRRDALWGAVAGIALYPAVSLVAGSIVLVVLRALTGHDVQVPDQLAPGLGLGGRVVAAVYALGIAPVAEELYFRGVLFRSLRDRHGFVLAAAASSLLFGLVHWPAATPAADAVVLPLVMSVTGVGLAWIYERGGNLVVPIVAHVVFNAIGLAIIFSGVGS